MHWDDVAVGAELPGFELAIDFRKVAMTPAVTLDYMPGHYDREYARAIGHPDVFMNTMPLFGLLDRAVTDWAGPETFITRHAIKLRTPVYAGDVVTATGQVLDKRVDDAGHLVEVAVQLAKDGGATVCCEGTVVARLGLGVAR